jgi:chromosomal replication initiator protein
MTDPALRLAGDHQTIWRLITEKLQEELPRQSFLTWFKPVKSLSYKNRTLVLQTPNLFYNEWIESHYADHIRKAVTATLGFEIELVYKPEDDGKKAGSGQPLERRMEGDVTLEEICREARLNHRYRFDNFIEGDCNRFARAAAVSTANKPGGTPFNPLLIYGGAGLGKTHLMQAIGVHILETGITHNVLYVTSEQFTLDFIKGIQSSRTSSFSRIYRNVDVLLLDDVQFFMAKEKTQEEFFHTFNALHQSGKQLIFSSDRPPGELEGFDERLVSRLQWGLVAELRLPDFETRVAIIKNRALEENIDLTDEIAHFLAVHVSDNIRSLHSALIHIMAQSSLISRPITIDLARDAVRNLSRQPSRGVSVDQIQETVAREFGLTSDLLKSKTRKKEIAQARQIAMYLAADLTKLTLKTIGLHFGGRDHATVIHARKTIKLLLQADSEMDSLVKRLTAKLETAAI